MQVSNLNRFAIAKDDIVKVFEENFNIIYSYEDISKILKDNRDSWRLSNISSGAFIDMLLKYTNMRRYSLEFPSRTINRLVWGDTSIYELGLSLEKNAYYSHYTAIFLNNLTDQIPKKLYITYEQPKKDYKRNTLMQKDIDTAFSKPQRNSSNIASFKDFSICLLNGQYSNKLGVIEVASNDKQLMVTGLERTLIDAVIRPSYSGGINEVLSAFSKASNEVSVNKLVAMLKKLDYVYPYHQAIGFYLQKSRMYSDNQINLLKKFNFHYDFYLTHQMNDPDYSREWRLYYPKGF